MKNIAFRLTQYTAKIDFIYFFHCISKDNHFPLVISCLIFLKNIYFFSLT